MKKRLGGMLVAMVTILVGASSATAATEVGSDCQGTNPAVGYTFVQLKKVSGSPPIAAPSGGVVTKWKVNSGFPTPVGQKLQILRATGGANQFQVVAESTPGTVSQGLNSFDTRLPIQAGDRPAVAGATGGAGPAPLYCATGNPEDEMGALTPVATLGSTNTFPPAPGLVAAISAVVEPDADGDGFGDETQDQCPQSASLQTPCPVAALSVSSVVRKGFVRVLVTSNTQASVRVAGTVKLGKGKKAKLSGSTQVVVPGTIAKFTLIFPAGLKSKLKELSRKQSLQLVLKATAPNVAAAPTVRTLKAKVKGQKKPLRKGKRG